MKRITNKNDTKLHMLNFKIEVGNEEKHVIECTLNQFWGYVLIKVDGQISIQEKLKMVGFKQNWTYDIVVGSWEIHDIKIQFVKSIFPVGLRDCTAWVTIDGEKAVEFNGKVSYKDNLFTAMNVKIKTVIIASWVILFLMVISLIAYHVPIKIDKELNGVLFRAGSTDTDYEEHMVTTIDGKYYRKLFSNDQFKGEIYIDGLYPEVDEELLHKEQLIDLFSNHYGVWWFTVGGYPYFEMDIISIYMDTHGDNVIINVIEYDEDGGGHSGGSDGLIYVAGCNSRKEAIGIVNEINTKIYRNYIK